MFARKKIVQSGFTFLEVVISLLVFSVGALTMLQAINVAMDAQYRASQEVIAANLAAALQSEIIAKDFEDPTVTDDDYLGRDPELAPLEDRTAAPGFSYDDVDDYNGYNDDPPITIDNNDMDGTTVGGVTMPSYQGFRRDVLVEFVTCDPVTKKYNPSVPPGSFTDTKRITVTINGPGVTNFQLIPLIKEQPPEE